MNLTMQCGDWATLGETAYAIRHEVFVQEQKVPEEIEQDEYDPVSLHVLAWANETPVGTGRLLDDGHIGRVAVRRAQRGTGVGRAIMEYLMAQAKDRGMDSVVLNAQVSALGFYRTLGFEETGGIFLEAGIEHIVMRKCL